MYQQLMPGLRLLWQRGSIGSAIEVDSREGEKYTLAAFPAGDTGWYVVAAVSWDKLMGPMMRFNRWPILVGLIGFLGIVSVLALWKWLVAPLRVLGNEVSSLQLGKDIPQGDDPSAVFEIRRLRQVLEQLARGAVERAQLMKQYVGDIVRVQEEERSRIAREIHDGPLRDVTALIRRSGFSRMVKDPKNEDTRHLENAEDGAIHAVSEMRALCDELSPPWLDLGLSQALTDDGRLSRHLEVEIPVEVDCDEELPADVTLSFPRSAGGCT